MSKPLVSVVIATYNAGPYLQEAIDSVLCQTVSDLELLVIDDGSTDGTRALVEAISDRRLSYVWQANAGQTSAKNHGIRLARGTFIAFCDGDDFWYPNKLELQLPLFAASPAVGVVYSAVEQIDEHGRALDHSASPLHRGNVTEQLFMSNFVPFGTSVVRRECIERVGAFDEALRMGIDWDLWLRISAHYEFDYVAAPTYAYRIWSGQMSRNWRGRYSSAFRIMEKFLSAHPGKISPALRRKAIADTYANRGRSRMQEHPFAAVGDGIRAVMYDPTAPYSWKTVGRTLKEALTPGQPRDASPGAGSLKRTLAPIALSLTADAPRVFVYHRFTEQSTDRAIGIDTFRKQMLLLKERCDILPLSELLESTSPRGARLRAAVTIDDGYADFFELAAPVLMELGIRATIFVTTGFIDGGIWLWPDRMRALLCAAPAGAYTLGGFWKQASVDLSTAEQREATWHQLADQLVFESDKQREQAITDLASSLGMDMDGLDMSPYRPMSWEQLRQLHEWGFEIADHSHSHACLTLMSPDELWQELSRSKSLLESRLGIRIRSFAYPNGTRRDYHPAIAQTLQRLGYDFAVLSVPTPTAGDPNFRIGRFPAAGSLEEFRGLVDGYGVLKQWLRL